MSCKTCQHPDRLAIEQAMLSGTVTYEALSIQYGLTISSLFRHKKSLELKMKGAREKLNKQIQQGILFQYNEYQEMARQFVRAAAAEGNISQALGAMREGTRILNFINKMGLSFDDDTTHRILNSPQWLSQDSLLPADPAVVTGGRQALAQDVSFPCPDLLLSEVDIIRDGKNAILDDLEKTPRFKDRPSLDFRDFGSIIAGMLTGSIPPPSRAPKTAPETKREKSAKSPKNTALRADIDEAYQSDSQYEKNLPEYADDELETDESETDEPDGPDQSLEPLCQEDETPSKPKRRLHDITYEEYLEEMAQAELSLKAPRPDTSALDPPLSDLPPGQHPKETGALQYRRYQVPDTSETIPDRRWEEDFGNPRRFKGAY